MADMGFLPDVNASARPDAGRTASACSSRPRWTVPSTAWSATTSRDPVAHAVVPAESHVADDGAPGAHRDARGQADVLAEIAGPRPARTLLFVRTKHGADRLAKQLDRLGVAAAGHPRRPHPGSAQRALDGFSRGRSRVLVATDVAARGIHVDDVDLVVHDDPPTDHKDYLHRSGRTARAGASGVVVSLLPPSRSTRPGGCSTAPVSRSRRSRRVPGSVPVRELAESGEPVVVTAPPARPAYETNGPRTSSGARRGEAPHRHRRSRRPRAA